MKSILPESLGCDVWVGGKRHMLRPTVANVLRAMDDMEDPTLTQADRIRLACWRLYRYPRPKDAVAGVNAAFDKLNEPSPYRITDKTETINLKQDAALICAAFRQLYGIDLPHAARRMDWRYFQALLGGITSDTAMGGIMDIRSMKVPKRTEYNGDHIADILKNKAAYAIRRKGNAAEKSFDAGLRGMVEILQAMAEGSD